MCPGYRKKCEGYWMVLVNVFADVQDALSRNSRIHWWIDWGVGAGGARVGLAVPVVVVMSPPGMSWPRSARMVVRILFCCGGRYHPRVKGYSGFYAGACGCLRLRLRGVGGTDQGTAECTEKLAHTGCISCSPFLS